MKVSCTCRIPPFYFDGYEATELGEDAQGADVSLLTCKRCGCVWLKYLLEEPHYSGAGRWWRVELTQENLADISVATARDFIESQASGFAGGSFFNSSGHQIEAPINVR